MKQVIEQYGSACVAIFFAGVIFMLFCGDESGLSNIIGKWMHKTDRNVFQETDGGAFDDFMKAQSPQIMLSHPYKVKTGEQIDLQTIFSAVATDQSLLPVAVLGCWKEDGTEVEDEVLDANQLFFDIPGIYWLDVYAVDKMGSDREVLLKLFVNEG